MTQKLFCSEGTQAVPNHPALCGGKCRACGYIFFPLQSYGCENCGSTELSPQSLSGRGRLIATAQVHVHHDPNRPPPFTIASIELMDGAVLRAVLETGGAPVVPGMDVVTMLVPSTRPDEAAPTLQFRLAGAEEI